MGESSRIWWLALRVFAVIQTAVCWNITQWPDPDRMYNITLQNMTRSPDTGHLYIGAVNYVYQLDADLNVINVVDTRWNATTDDTSTMVILNRTLTGTYQITTCGSSSTKCQIRNSSNISNIVDDFTPVIHTPGSKAFTVEYAGSLYVFIACPHADNVRDGMACEHPGIVWQSSQHTRDGAARVHFRPKSDRKLNVTTEYFVAAFPVENYRLFFSVQQPRMDTRHSHGGSQDPSSRIAMICQTGELEDKTVYADMKIKCGEYTKLTAAKYIETNTGKFIVAAFRALNRPGSAICVYEFASVKWRFVENIQLCYNGSRGLGTDNYIDTSKMCRKANLRWETVPNDTFLCNSHGLDIYNRVIGNLSLAGTPAIVYNSYVITGLSLLQKEAEILAYLGTENGYIIKAVVHPPDHARKLANFTTEVSFGEPIGGDMFLDLTNGSLFVMTPYKIGKVQLEYCSRLGDCQQCLGGRDPFCGWCMLDNSRCSTEETCDRDWVASTGNSSCPAVQSVVPTILPVSTTDSQLQIHLSHLPSGVNLSCLFENTDLVFKQMTGAVADNGTIMCRSPDVRSVAADITGSISITVAIVSNVTSEPFAEGQMTYFNCETFNSCGRCTEKDWNCNWCLHDNACVTQSGTCNHLGTVTSLNGGTANISECPVVYTIHEIPRIMDPEGTLYIPTNTDHYEVTVEGKYLPQPEDRRTYTCEADIERKVSFPATWINKTEVACHLNKVQSNLY